MFSIDLSDVITQAGAIVTGLMGLVAVIGGLRLGFRLVDWIIQEISHAF